MCVLCQLSRELKKWHVTTCEAKLETQKFVLGVLLYFASFVEEVFKKSTACCVHVARHFYSDNE